MLSKKHETIFVHIPKCAGQTIETLFLNDLGLNWQDDQRAKLLLRFNDQKTQGPERLAHLFAQEYLDFKYVTPEEFLSFYKFAIVRNPIDRLISELNWRGVRRNLTSRPGKPLRIEEYVNWAMSLDPMNDIYRHCCPQAFYIYDKNFKKSLVTDVFKFEQLSSLKNRLLNLLFHEIGAMPQINKTTKTIWKKEDLLSQDVDFIKEFYSMDYQLFEY